MNRYLKFIPVIVLVALGFVVYFYKPIDPSKGSVKSVIKIDQITEINSFEHETTGDGSIYQLYFENGEGPPIGYVKIDSNGKAVAKLYNFQIQNESDIKYDEDTDRYGVTTKLSWVLKESPKINEGLVWKDVPYGLSTKSSIVVDPSLYKNRRIFSIAPKPFVNFGMGYSDRSFSVPVGVGFTIIDFGYKCRLNEFCNSNFKFGGFGVDYNIGSSSRDWSNLGVSIYPILINTRLFKLPLFHNLYMGPYFGNQGGNFKTGLSLNISL